MDLAKAVASNNEPEVLRLLEESPDSLDQVDGHGNTLLNSACAIGASPNLIIALIEAGADVSKPNNRGAVPLISAVYANVDSAVFAALVNNGADPNYRNDAGGTALQIACVVKLPLKSIQALVDLGCDVDLANNNGYTPLMLAARNRLDVETVKILSAKSKNLDARVNDDDLKFPGYTAMHFAVQEKVPGVASALLSFGAQLSISNTKGETPLFLADAATRQALMSSNPRQALAQLPSASPSAPPMKTKNTPAADKPKRKSIWKAMNDENPIFAVTAGLVARPSQWGGGASTDAAAKKKKEAGARKKTGLADYEDALDVFNEERLARAKASRKALRDNPSGPPVKFPQHNHIPFKNIFEGRSMAEPSRLIFVLEDHLMTGTSIARAWSFRPQPGDVIVVAAPCSGQQVVQRIVRFLQADKPLEVSADKKGQAPWLESRYMDADSSWMTPEKSQGSSVGRVFQTTMTLDVLHLRIVDKATRYVVVLRNPVDLRFAYYQYLRQCYELKQETDYKMRPWEDMYVPDDFIDNEVTLCDAGQMNKKAKTYEQFLLEWVLESNNNPEMVCLVFYESLLSRPTREIKRIAAFLDLPAHDDVINLILKDATTLGLGAQGANALGGARVALRRMTLNKLGNIQSSQLSPSATPVAQLTAGKGRSQYSKPSLGRIRLRWIVVNEMIKHASTYDELYESLYGDPYPFKVKTKTIVGCFGTSTVVDDDSNNTLSKELEDAQKAEEVDRAAKNAAISVRLTTGTAASINPRFAGSSDARLLVATTTTTTRLAAAAATAAVRGQVMLTPRPPVQWRGMTTSNGEEKQGDDKTGNTAQQQQQPPPPQNDENVITQLKKDLEEAKKAVLYERAETENVRKRGQRETSDARTFAVTSFAKSIIDVADNLERAIAMFSVDKYQNDVPVMSLIEGVKGTDRILTKTLKEFTIEPFGEVGDKCDPNRYQSLYQVADATNPPNTVIKVLRKGYTIGGTRVLRVAHVATSSKVPGT